MVIISITHPWHINFGKISGHWVTAFGARVWSVGCRRWIWWTGHPFHQAAIEVQAVVLANIDLQF